MTTTEWAEREVEIACKKENPDRKEGEWDYGCACYESALKAYKSLMEDGHSGFSFGITMNILERLMRGQPLTPIEDTDDVWNECYRRIDPTDHVTYHCKRMSSLFKHVYDDGHVEYRDINRIVCVDTDSDCSYSNGFIERVIEEMVGPITMPYSPTKEPIKVYISDYLYDPKNGDFDTIAINYCIMPDGDKWEVNRYFKHDGKEWVEIDKIELMDRLAVHMERDYGKKEEE